MTRLLRETGMLVWHGVRYVALLVLVMGLRLLQRRILRRGARP